MGVFVSLSPSEVRVEPGQQATCEIKIRNTGEVVDQFTLELIGELGDWVSLEPKVVNLFPDAEAQAKLVFSPPKSSEVKAGETAFAVRVASREDPEGSSVEEGSVTVAPFVKIGGEFVPHGSRGALRGRHRLAVDNHGNTAAAVQIGLTAPDGELRFKIRRQSLTVEPGTAVLVPVRAIPKKWFLKGPKKTHPFQATITGEDFEPETADAAMVQEQLLPTWLFKALGALIAVLIVLVVLWFTLLRPIVKSEATNTAKEQTGQLAAGIAQASEAASDANAKAQNVQNAVVDAGIPVQGAAPPSPGAQHSSASPSPSPTAGQGATPTPAPAPTATPAPAAPTAPATAAATAGAAGAGSDLSLQANAAAGKAGTFQTVSYTVPAGKSFLISDLVASNPNGDSGALQIRRGGATLIPLGLDNFRTYDQHFIQPIVIPGGQQLVIAVDCRNPAAPCTPSVYFSGQLK